MIPPDSEEGPVIGTPIFVAPRTPPGKNSVRIFNRIGGFSKTNKKWGDKLKKQ